jgi:ABC-type transporter Mla subunit MlaD
LVYKPAAYKNETDKNHYYDFLQRELLPFLNIGVSKSLGSFKDVLNHFIIKFGENMDDYKDSGQLLNDNLQKQQTVLEEINKLSLTRTATKIAEVFADLKESSEHLEKFQAYQKGLNSYLDKTEKVADEMNTIIDQFKDFNTNLKVISNNTVATIELQKQFKDSLEKHFPVIQDHREVWRIQVDELNQDIKEVYKELNGYFKTSTEQIQSFIGSNNNFFTGRKFIYSKRRV